jgi:hypothetical protein
LPNASKEQRSCFSGDACQREHDTGDDAGQRGGHEDGRHRLRASGPSAAPFTQRVRYQQKQFLGRPRDDRNHHDAERQAAGQHAEVLETASTATP